MLQFNQSYTGAYIHWGIERFHCLIFEVLLVLSGTQKFIQALKQTYICARNFFNTFGQNHLEFLLYGSEYCQPVPVRCYHRASCTNLGFWQTKWRTSDTFIASSNLHCWLSQPQPSSQQCKVPCHKYGNQGWMTFSLYVVGLPLFLFLLLLS